MNILCGMAGKPIPGKAKEVSRKLGDLYDVTCNVLNGGESGFAVYSEDSMITGIAGEDSQKMILHGAVHHPVAEWKKSDSPLDDTSETVSHMLSLWKKHDQASAGMVSGSFACCFFDETVGKSFLFCDPDGMRNLYVYQNDNRVWFANNPKALALIAPGITIDRTLEDFFLVYGFWPDGRTAYKNLSILPAGGVMAVDHNGSRFHTVDRFQHKDFPGWDFDFNGADLDEAIDVLYYAFMRAMEDQTAGEKKVAVLLGGVDSALVAACLKSLGKQVETFSFYYDIESFNQPHTDTLSDFLGTKHTWVLITPDIILNGHENWGLRYCQPTNWANYVIQTSHLCSIIREKGINRCYSGDGCDGTFLGYPNVHRSSSVYAGAKQLPGWILSLLLAPMRFSLTEYTLSRVYTVALSVLRSFARFGPARGFLTFRVMDELSLPRLRGDEHPFQEITVDEKLYHFSKGLSHLSYDRLAYMGKNMVSPNKAKMNGCMDNENLTVLSPYLHPELKNMGQKIPDDLLRPQGLDKSQKKLGKFILLKMIQKYNLLPDEVIYQPKISAVDAPVDDWYSHKIKNEMVEIIKGLPFKVNERYIKFLFKEHMADKLYKNYFCSDSVTSHVIALLSTYATYTKNLSARTWKLSQSKIPELDIEK